jgi:hypothetical protein
MDEVMSIYDNHAPPGRGWDGQRPDVRSKDSFYQREYAVNGDTIQLVRRIRELMITDREVAKEIAGLALWVLVKRHKVAEGLALMIAKRRCAEIEGTR